jgi:hypothetical protein
VPDDVERPWPTEIHGLAVGPYTSHAAVLGELTRLGELRSSYRRSRWVITELWIVTAGMLAVLAMTRWSLLVLPVAAFTLLAVHRSRRADVYPERGRELDEDIADAQKRLRGLLQGEGR